MEYDYIYKYVLLGNSGVGKTSIMRRYLEKQDPIFPSQPTIGVDFRLKTGIVLNNKKIKLHLWDTAGQECFNSLIESYYKGIAGAIIVFDLTDNRSFQSVQHWLNQIAYNSSTNIRCPILLVGNKSDLENERVISKLEAETFASDNKLLYGETTAYNNSDIEQCMNILIDETTKHYIDGKIECAGVKHCITLVSAIDSTACYRNPLDCCRPS